MTSYLTKIFLNERNNATYLNAFILFSAYLETHMKGKMGVISVHSFFTAFLPPKMSLLGLLAEKSAFEGLMKTALLWTSVAAFYLSLKRLAVKQLVLWPNTAWGIWGPTQSICAVCSQWELDEDRIHFLRAYARNEDWSIRSPYPTSALSGHLVQVFRRCDRHLGIKIWISDS